MPSGGTTSQTEPSDTLGIFCALAHNFGGCLFEKSGLPRLLVFKGPEFHELYMAIVLMLARPLRISKVTSLT